MAHHQARKAINDYLGEVNDRTQRARTATQDLAFEDFSETHGAERWAREAWKSFEDVKPGEFSTREAYVHAVLGAINATSTDEAVSASLQLRQEVLEQIPVLAGMPVPVVLKLALDRLQPKDNPSTLPVVLEVRHFVDGEWRGLLETSEVDEVCNALERRGKPLGSLAISREVTATAQRYIIRVTWANAATP